MAKSITASFRYMCGVGIAHELVEFALRSRGRLCEYHGGTALYP